MNLQIRQHRKLLLLRRQACKRQNFRCFYCQHPIWETHPEVFAERHQLPPKLVGQLKSTAEHLVAKQDKGPDTYENIAAACLWCNTHRHLGRALTAPNPLAYKLEVEDFVSQGQWHPATGKIAQLLNPSP